MADPYTASTRTRHSRQPAGIGVPFSLLSRMSPIANRDPVMAACIRAAGSDMVGLRLASPVQA